jgi:hypothetical protein
MKKTIKIPPPPKVGDERVIDYYTVFPVTIINNDVIEKRWMERVYIKQVFCCEYNPSLDKYEYFWKDLQFVNNEQALEKIN